MRRVNTTVAVDSVINAVLVVGTLSVAVVAPNATQLFGKALLKHLDKTEHEKEMKRVLRYMRQRKYIEINELPSGLIEVSVTEKGKKRKLQADFEKLVITKPKTWDKKWRIVIFDIPNEFKQAHNALNSKLRELGFQVLQRSTWINPFPCEEQIAVVKTVYGIEKFVSYMEVDYIDSHNKLVQRFSKLLK